MVAAAAALGVAACGSSSTSTGSSPTGASKVGPPLYEEATTGVTFTQNFNPFDSASLAAGMNMRSLLYEPLYEFDALDPTASHPWLATGYSFSNGGKTLSITVRPSVKFNDGSAMTANDVANTFNIIYKYKDANYSGVPAQASAPSVSGSTVTLSFQSAQYTNLWAILGSTYIVPASAFPIGTDPATTTVSNPVGTGPFMLDTFSTTAVTFKPNPHYWGGTPPESKVIIPNEATNQAALAALQQGQLDWAGNDLPSIVANYINLNPNTNHVWFAAGNTVTLEFNLMPGNGGATGIDQAAVRQAVSMGIDRGEASSIGESGYEAAATSSGGLLPGQQTAYKNPKYTNDLPGSPAIS